MSPLERAAIRWAHDWARRNGWKWSALLTHYPFQGPGWASAATKHERSILRRVAEYVKGRE